MMPSSRLERPDLPYRVLHAGDGPEDMFGESRRVAMLVQAQNALLDVGREAKEHEHLGHADPADAFASGDGGLVGNFPCIQLPLPFKGLAERFDHRRRPGCPTRLWRLRWPWRIPRWWDGADHAVGGHVARQTSDVAVLERSVGSKRDLNGLFAEFCGTFDVVGGYVDDAEPDFRDGPAELTEGTPGSRIGLELEVGGLTVRT